MITIRLSFRTSICQSVQSVIGSFYFQHDLKHFDEKSLNKEFCDVWKYRRSVNTSPLVFKPPPLHLRQCVALFAIAEGWLLLDI